MEYTVKALAELSGVTPRTLRWYDRLGLLKPGRLTQAGYRLYGPAEVDRLQQILFYRELEVPLAEIGAILDDPNFDRQAALEEHLRALSDRRSRLDDLILTVQQTLQEAKGEIMMQDKEKFRAFQKKPWRLMRSATAKKRGGAMETPRSMPPTRRSCPWIRRSTAPGRRWGRRSTLPLLTPFDRGRILPGRRDSELPPFMPGGCASADRSTTLPATPESRSSIPRISASLTTTTEKSQAAPCSFGTQ